MLIKSTKKRAYFCLESTTAPLVRSEDLRLSGGERCLSAHPWQSPSFCRRASQAVTIESTSRFRQTLRPAHNEGSSVSSPHQRGFSDNKAECILQGWTFSPRMSHYQVLIILISQPLESCPAFYRQRWGENDCGGDCTLPGETLTICSQLSLPVWNSLVYGYSRFGSPSLNLLTALGSSGP